MPPDSDDEGSPRGARNLRDRKEAKLYADDWMLADDEEVICRGFSLEEKIETDSFPPCYVKEMLGSDLTLAHIQKNGFNTPLLFVDKAGLGLKVPSSDLTVSHVKMAVGPKRLVDVMDVNTQKNHQMTMKEWCKYYEDPDKERLLNVISLEFSHTQLDDYVTSPTIVRQLDWVDTVWPSHLKESQTESTNAIDDMMYPKVQKYCLMSVRGCYTDFHIDFGGTSVWYHVLRGQKIFWLIPPTETNRNLYQNWVLSGKQSDVFFGDTVEKCCRIRLHAGYTFFIPSGWIHAVFTPEDSLVFGGNFLHSFAIDSQLKIAKVEHVTKVPQKFRYPFFTEMLWYVLQKYVLALVGNNHLDLSDDEIDSPAPTSKRICMTPLELHGLRAIVMYLHALPPYKKNVPDLIKDPVALIKDIRLLVQEHLNDRPEDSVTGRSILTGVEDSQLRPKLAGMKQENRARFAQQQNNSSASLNSSGCSPTSSSQGGKSSKNSKNNGPRRRRTRCKKCEACQRSDCGECSFCLDMVKFGGPGRAKQTCVMRQCLQPMLPVTAGCALCGLDGWGQQPVIPIQKTPRDTPSSLMECSVCYDIAHPACYPDHPGMDGVPNDDLPNSWECPKCCKAGRNREYRPRHFRARQKSSEVRRTSGNGDQVFDSEKCDLEVDSDSGDEGSRSGSPDRATDTKRVKLEDGAEVTTQHSQGVDAAAHNHKVLARPPYVVRPVARHTTGHDGDPVMMRSVMVPIFRFLTPRELVECALVCQAWARFSLDSSLWRRMDFSHRKLTTNHLIGIGRRQPEVLILDWSNVAKKQLKWLIDRLPQLRGLSAQGCPWSSISSLATCVCPPLHLLDLSFVGGLNDSSLRDILSPPADSRPGLIDTRTRLRHLRCLKIAGCDVTDVSIRYIITHLQKLAVLDISSCTRITDAGVVQLATAGAPTRHTLTCVNLSHLRALTDVSLDHLAKCQALLRVNITHTPLITREAVDKLRLNLDDVEIIGKD